jgi:hypothetical protein
VVLCYGLFGEVMAPLRPLGLDYMADQRAWLTRIGIPVTVAKLPTAAPVAANAARLAEVIRTDPRRCVIVAHSKGGIEALAALLLPGTADHCRAFLALQVPFRGSPVADAALRLGPLRLAADPVLRLVRLGERQGVLDLTTPVREAWMREHEPAIRDLARRLPMTSLATTVGNAADWRDRPHAVLARWLERQGAGPNDGLVPVSSTILPGARHAVLPGGHRALVAAGPGRDPVGLLCRELARLLGVTPSRPPPSPAPYPRSP